MKTIVRAISGIALEPVDVPVLVIGRNVIKESLAMPSKSHGTLAERWTAARSFQQRDAHWHSGSRFMDRSPDLRGCSVQNKKPNGK